MQYPISGTPSGVRYACQVSGLQARLRQAHGHVQIAAAGPANATFSNTFCCVQVVATMQRAWNMTIDGGGKFGEHPQAMRSRQRNLQPSRSQPLITEAARRLQARGHLMEDPYHSPDKMPQLQGRHASQGSPARSGKGRQLKSAQSAGAKHPF